MAVAEQPSTIINLGSGDRDFRSLKMDYLKPTEGHPVPQFRLVTATDGDYGALLRQAFAFFRRHAQGRYSAGSLMRILQAADRFDELGPSSAANLPELGIATLPFSYDEETEVKTGGMVGVIVVFPSDNYRTILAVHTNRRRQGVGTVLVRAFTGALRYQPLIFWVGSQNFDGQKFLLNLQLFPSLINSQGAIRYSNGTEAAEV